ELLACRESPRHETRGALRSGPRAEVLDHGLRMHVGLGVGSGIARRRRASEACGTRGDLGHDLLVRVALADPALELRQLLRIDRGDCPVAGLLGHANKCRADWRIRK